MNDAVNVDPTAELAREERDKQVEQFMKINGQATFAALTTAFVVVFGAKDLPGLGAMSATGRYFLFGILVLGAGLLAYGAYRLSSFHTSRIRKLQKICEEKNHGLPPGSYQVIPPGSMAFAPVFAGVLMIVAFALAIMFFSMPTKPETDRPAASSAAPASPRG